MTTTRSALVCLEEAILLSCQNLSLPEAWPCREWLLFCSLGYHSFQKGHCLLGLLAFLCCFARWFIFVVVVLVGLFVFISFFTSK